MTKKEFMLQVIAFLPDWKMGWGLKPLIENNQLEPDVFEKLYQIFREMSIRPILNTRNFNLRRGFWILRLWNFRKELRVNLIRLI